MVGRLFCGVAVSIFPCSPLSALFTCGSALTVGLERYIVYPPGVDFGKILMTQQDGRTFSSRLSFIYSLIPFGLQPLRLSPRLPNA